MAIEKPLADLVLVLQKISQTSELCEGPFSKRAGDQLIK